MNKCNVWGPLRLRHRASQKKKNKQTNKQKTKLTKKKKQTNKQPKTIHYNITKW